MSDDRDDDDKPYKVGYRRPPKANRFQKGQSGNPGGRPKGGRSTKVGVPKTLAELVHQYGTELIKIRRDGAVETVSRNAAIILGAFADAARGNNAARKFIFELQKLASADAVARPQSYEIRDDASEQEIADWYAKVMRDS